MNSEEYWKKRESEALKYYITQEAGYDKQIKEIYSSMLNACQKEINAFYGKYAASEGITMAEAKKRVSQLDIAAYERKAKKYVAEKNFSNQANEEMRLYNATMKINRLEMLKANIGLELIASTEELNKFMEEILQGRTEEELQRQAGILGETIKNNAQLAHAIPNASFHNATFSDRLWMNQSLLRSEISKLLQSGLIQGKNPRVLAKELQVKFGQSQYNAERLMRTELARVQTEAQKQSFVRNGFKEYTFLTNTGCCAACAALNGKHFKVIKMMPGENAPPMHPNCRCSTAAYEDSAEYEKWIDFLDKGGTTAEYNKLRLTGKNKKQSIHNIKDDILKNKLGQEITFDEKIIESERWKDAINVLKELAGEYNTRLQKVGIGAHQSAGMVDISGSGMKLSAKHKETAIHEFAHTLSNVKGTKYGVMNDDDFWSDIRKIRANYRKAVKKDNSLMISQYADTVGGSNCGDSLDEFMAEAFTQAIAFKKGIKLSDKYGNDLTYSSQVLEIIDKYFKKTVKKERYKDDRNINNG